MRRRNSSDKDLRGAGTEFSWDGTGSLKCNLGSTGCDDPCGSGKTGGVKLRSAKHAGELPGQLAQRSQVAGGKPVGCTAQAKAAPHEAQRARSRVRFRTPAGSSLVLIKQMSCKPRLASGLFLFWLHHGCQVTLDSAFTAQARLECPPGRTPTYPPFHLLYRYNPPPQRRLKRQAIRYRSEP